MKKLNIVGTDPMSSYAAATTRYNTIVARRDPSTDVHQLPDGTFTIPYQPHAYFPGGYLAWRKHLDDMTMLPDDRRFDGPEYMMPHDDAPVHYMQRVYNVYTPAGEVHTIRRDTTANLYTEFPGCGIQYRGMIDFYPSMKLGEKAKFKTIGNKIPALIEHIKADTLKRHDGSYKPANYVDYWLEHYEDILVMDAFTESGKLVIDEAKFTEIVNTLLHSNKRVQIGANLVMQNDAPRGAVLRYQWRSKSPKDPAATELNVRNNNYADKPFYQDHMHLWTFGELENVSRACVNKIQDYNKHMYTAQERDQAARVIANKIKAAHFPMSCRYGKLDNDYGAIKAYDEMCEDNKLVREAVDLEDFSTYDRLMADPDHVELNRYARVFKLNVLGGHSTFGTVTLPYGQGLQPQMSPFDTTKKIMVSTNGSGEYLAYAGNLDDNGRAGYQDYSLNKEQSDHEVDVWQTEVLAREVAWMLEQDTKYQAQFLADNWVFLDNQLHELDPMADSLDAFIKHECAPGNAHKHFYTVTLKQRYAKWVAEFGEYPLDEETSRFNVTGYNKGESKYMDDIRVDHDEDDEQYDDDSTEC